MGRGVRKELAPPLHREIDLARRYDSLLLDPMRNNRSDTSVKEVQHSIVPAGHANPQLVNVVAKQIGFGTAKLVSQVAQPLDPHNAPPSHPFGEL
jgi:hypothetical protein